MSDPFKPFSPPATLEFRDATAPGVSADIERVLSPAATPKPQMREPEGDVVELPAGVTLMTGQVARTARVRELRGGDEEDLASAAASAQPERLINTLLTAGVVSVGDQPVTPDVLDNMLVGDRDALVVGIRKATFGKTVEYESYTCTACAGTFALSVDLDDIPTVRQDEPTPTFEVALKGGRRAKVRHATGAMQTRLLTATREKRLTVPQQDSLVLSMAVLALDNGDGVWRDVSANLAHAQNMSMADRRAIMREMHNLRPGPRMDQIKISCPDCGHVEEIGLDVGALFRG